MSIAPQIRSAADTLLGRLTDDLRQHVDGVVRELTDAAEADETSRLGEAEALFQTRQTEQLDALRAEHAAALGHAEQEAQDAREALDTGRAELEAAQAALALARAEAETLRADADTALAQAEAAVAEVVAQAETRAEQSRAVAVVESAHLARHEAADRLSALAHATSAMDDATTLSEVLDALAGGLSAQADRSVVLVFKGDAARVWRRAGFTDTPSEVGDALALETLPDLKAIVESSAPAYLEGRGDEQPLLGVATLPVGTTGFAVPVAIGGQVAALVYADAGAQAEGTTFPGWADLVEVLARHAARCLEALTAMRASGYARPRRPAVVVPMPPHLRVVERKAALDSPVGDAIEQAQRVARLLVSEIRLNREEDIRLGREAGDLGARLDGDIDRARQQYLARVSDGVPGRNALFDEEVVRTLANGNAELLRRPTGS